jgi:hypothetical protein
MDQDKPQDIDVSNWNCACLTLFPSTAGRYHDRDRYGRESAEETTTVGTHRKAIDFHWARLSLGAL